MTHRTIINTGWELMKKSTVIGISLVLLACSSTSEKRGLASPVGVVTEEGNVMVVRKASETEIEVIQCEQYVVLKTVEDCKPAVGTQPARVSLEMFKQDLMRALSLPAAGQHLEEGKQALERASKPMPEQPILAEIAKLQEQLTKIEDFVAQVGETAAITKKKNELKTQLEKHAQAIALKQDIESAREKLNELITQVVNKVLSQDFEFMSGFTHGKDFTYNLLLSYMKLPPKQPASVPSVAYDENLEKLLGKFVQISGVGTFQMGSTKGDSDETPHSMTLTKVYEIQSTEVTQAMWVEVMGNDPSHFKDKPDNHPVENVSWDGIAGANGFIDRLNKRLSGGTYVYRLPSEAEWEFAARAGSSKEYSFGDDASKLGEYAWFGEDWDKGSTHPAGTKQPNAWGIYDMHGNVWEWVQDLYGSYPNPASADYVNNEKGLHRVSRGGGWNSLARYCRSAFRYNGHPGLGFRNLGFRLVRTVK